MKKIALTTAMILIIPAMCLANYKITYVEYYTPDKPGPLHQRIKVVEAKEYVTWNGIVTYLSIENKSDAIKSPFIEIKEIDLDEFPGNEPAKFTAID